VWVALVFATIAVSLFWGGAFTPPRVIAPTHDPYLRRFIRLSFAAAGLGCVFALAGKGDGRWRTVLAAVSVPFAWTLYAAME